MNELTSADFDWGGSAGQTGEREGRTPAAAARAPAAEPARKAAAKATRQRPAAAKQGRPALFEDLEPWAEPVDGAELLDAIAETVGRYVVLPLHAAIAIALWTLHAWALDAFDVSPILCPSSPTFRSGKTTLLIVLHDLCPRPLVASGVTPAVVFRAIERYAPTLIVDEGDTIFLGRDDSALALKGILNSGHTRATARILRAVGEDHDPQIFSTWAPKIIALNGRLPSTLHDRSVVIPMRRKAPTERVERLRQDRIASELLPIRRQCARWAEDYLDALRELDPALPLGLSDRAADCWRPLMAVADLAGGEWPSRARAAALALSSGEPDADDAVTMLLVDTRAVFAEAGDPETLGSEELVRALVGRPDRPWAEWSHGRPLSAAKLARLLSGCGVPAPAQYRVGAERIRGYRRASFEGLWAAYTPTPPVEVRQRDNPNESGPNSSFQSVTPDPACHTSKMAKTPMNTGLCHTVTLLEGGYEGKGGNIDVDDF